MYLFSKSIAEHVISCLKVMHSMLACSNIISLPIFIQKVPQLNSLIIFHED